MTLPLPYLHRGQVVKEIELKRPTARVLAEANRLASTGDPYAAMSAFCAGSTLFIRPDKGAEIATPHDISDAIRDMPYQDVNWLIVQILLSVGRPDVLEGSYTCPRCGTQLPQDEESPDRVSELKVNMAPEPQSIKRTLAYPVEVKDSKGELAERVEELEFRFPTLNDCSRGVKKVGFGSYGKLQLAILLNAMVAGNGQQVDEKWRSEYGDIIIGRLDSEDLRAINQATLGFGYVEKIPKHCFKCEKNWDAVADLSSFFASGLQAMSE